MKMAEEPNITPAQTNDGTPPAKDTPPVDKDKPAEGDKPPVDKDKKVEGDKPPVDKDKKVEGDEPPVDKDKKVEGDDKTSPESYSDFTLPEGVELDEALMAKATPIFKELNLSQEDAQKLVDLQAEMVQEGARSQGESFNQLMKDWQNESANDKEFGGDKFEENIGIAKLAIDKFGTPELKELMEDHGVGNHPEMIRFMWKIGSLLKEDVPGGISNATSEKKSRTDILYPKESKK
jgi:hypothetical protein